MKAHQQTISIRRGDRVTKLGQRKKIYEVNEKKNIFFPINSPQAWKIN